MRPLPKKTKDAAVSAGIAAVAKRELPFAFPVRAAFARLPKHALPLAAMWIAALLCYSNAFHGGLVLDSAPRIVQDTRVHVATKPNIDLIFKSDYRYPEADSGL